MSSRLAKTLLGDPNRPVSVVYGTATGPNTVTLAGSTTPVTLPALAPVRSGDYVAVLVQGADRVILGEVGAVESTTYVPGLRNQTRADVTKTVNHVSYRVADGWCSYVGRLSVTSNSAGTGNILVDLPVPCRTNDLVLGQVLFFDSGVGWFQGAGIVPSGVAFAQAGFILNASSGLSVTQLAIGDALRFNFHYPV